MANKKTMSKKASQALILFLGLFVTSMLNATPLNVFSKRFILYAGNMGDQVQVNRLTSIMQEAASLGYTGIVLSDSGNHYNRLYEQSDAYIANLKTINAIAKGLGLEIVPKAFHQLNPVYFAILTDNDVIPVKETPYVVSGGYANVQIDSSLAIANPDFENYS